MNINNKPNKNKAMKKTTILLCLILALLNLQAQKTMLSKPVSNMWLMRPMIVGTPIGQDADHNYFYVGVPSKSKTNTNHIYVVDKNTMKFEDITVSLSGMHTLLGALNTDDQIVALYRSTNKKGDLVTFSIAAFEKKDQAVSVTDINSVNTTANSHFWPSYKTATSPNGKLMAALVMVTGKNSMLENIHAVVINDEGKFVWNGPVKPQFKGQSFSLGNLSVDNDGNIYVPAYTCNVKGNKVSDVQFLVIRANSSGSETFTADATFGKPQNFTGKVLSNGDLAIAGFFTDTYQNTMTQSNGYFFYRFDTKSETFSEAKSFDFSSNYAQKNAPARLARVLANQQYSITADDIYELENGSLALCGEHHFVKEVYDMNTHSTTYQLLTKNILIATLKTDGTSAFSMIEKQQIGGGSSVPQDWKLHNISYSAFTHKSNLYFLFNDDSKNIPYPGNGTVCNMGGLKMNTSDKCVLMTLTPDQEITQRVLPNGDQVMRGIEFADDENFYVSGISKNGFYLNKFSIEE